MHPCETRAIASVLPPGVVCADSRGDGIDPPMLHPDEARSVADAIPRRQREFARGRDCARRALFELGVTPRAIPVGPGREPVWPLGVVGSITHTHGYCAAAVGLETTCAALGIDVERNERLPGGVLSRVTSRCEQDAIAALPGTTIAWDRLVFSAKESVFKAWYPLTATWIDFPDVELVIRPEPAAPDRGTFDAYVHTRWPVTDRLRATVVRGSFAAADGLIVTAVVIPRSPTGPGPV